MRLSSAQPRGPRAPEKFSFIHNFSMIIGITKGHKNISKTIAYGVVPVGRGGRVLGRGEPNGRLWPGNGGGIIDGKPFDC